MKHIMRQKKYDESEIAKALDRSIKSGDIKMKISFDEFVKKSLYLSKPNIGTFQHLVMSEFISAADEKRMKQYMTDFKELGIDISELISLYPEYEKYLNHPIDPPYIDDYVSHYTNEDGEHVEDEEEMRLYETELEQWHTLCDKYEKIREKFNKEVIRLCKIAKDILDM